MTIVPSTDLRTDAGPTLPPPVRVMILSFLYWLTFLLVLEPGNILGADSRLLLSQETLRIIGASLLGAATTPLLLAIVRRFPVTGNAAWRNAGIQLAGSLAIAAGLIVASCIGADWLLVSEHRPFLTALGEEFEANWALVAFCIGGFIALAHAWLFRDVIERQPAAVKRSDIGTYLQHVAVKARGRVTYLDLAEVDWIESQGNYLALHAGAQVHLIRESLGALEAQLDPKCFVRIHRRTIIALDRVAAMTGLGAGDACLGLKDGTTLRLSRTYRSRFLETQRG